MRLELAGEQVVGAPIAMVWQRLMDAQFVASCAPGVEKAAAVDATHFDVIAALGVGSIKLRFTLHVALSDVEPPTRARMTVQGDAPGTAARAECGATLAPLGADSTQLEWTLASDIHGTVANVGARLLGGTVRRMTATFWKTFAVRAARRTGAKPAPRTKTQSKTRRSRRK